LLALALGIGTLLNVGKGGRFPPLEKKVPRGRRGSVLGSGEKDRRGVMQS